MSLVVTVAMSLIRPFPQCLKTMAKKVINTEAMNEFKKELVKIWGESKSGTNMVEWAMKNHTPYLMSNGYLFLVDRPHIETNFCFGYHTDFSGHECSDAENLREKCSKSENYFRTENLRKLRDEYYRFISDEPLYWIPNYDKSDKIMFVVTERNRQNFYTHEHSELITPEDRKLLVEAMKTEIDKFDKRLTTYLKRYGLSKLNTWTYWLDE